ncbi:MAG: pilus assembly PilX N-terminal domain-containing protein [Patescibacteria group bacterium]|jgi:hypothetical protein
MSNNKGAALILTVLLTMVILFLAIYYLNFSLTEKRISKNQVSGVNTYYLAEAGIADMVFKLKNDESYKNSFEINPAWIASFTRTDPFGTGTGSYTVTISNSAFAHGEIISTGLVDIGGGKTSQRIVKTTVFKAMGEGINFDTSGYADGNIDITASRVNFSNGNVHSNGNILITLLSLVNASHDLNATGNFNESWFSTVNVGGAIHAHNNPYSPAAEAIAMPAIDFDSDDLNSLKNRATVTYTSAQFDTLMKNNQNLTLPGPITYVTGDIDVYGAQNLIVNGILVAGRDFTVGENDCRQHPSRCGKSDVTVNHADGAGSGILAKRKVNFDSDAGDININGLVYANDQFNIDSFTLFQTNDFNITGAAIGRKLSILSCGKPINIIFNQNNILELNGAGGEFSPVITVEHWEEEY